MEDNFSIDSERQQVVEPLLLQDERTGELVEFDSFNEADLPFLGRDSVIVKQLKEAMIKAEIDDDCQTDDELIVKAKYMQGEQLREAVEAFAFNRPYSDEYIANLNL